MSLILNGTDNTVGAPAVTGSTGGTGTGVYYPATNQVAVATNGVNAITVDASQKVGIGTASPNSYGGLLNVVSTTAGSSKINISDWSAGASPAPLLQFGVNSSNGFVSTDAARVWATSPSSTTAALNFAAYNGGAPSSAQMTLTNGNVGIGTTAPGYKFHVIESASQDIGVTFEAATAGYAVNMVLQGNNAAGSRYNNIACRYGSTYQWQIGGGGSDSTIAFKVGSSLTEAMRIDSSGNLFVDCTATPNGTTRRGFEVVANTGLGDATAIQLATTTSSTRALIIFNNSNGNVGSVGTTGSSTYYATSSDYRLKENIVPMTGALNSVAALKPVTYDWKVGGTGQGFIAHELAEVCPQAVVGEKDAVETVDELDDEGKVIGTKEVPKYQSIDTSFLVATLTAAIQELKAEFDAYKATHP